MHDGGSGRLPLAASIRLRGEGGWGCGALSFVDAGFRGGDADPTGVASGQAYDRQVVAIATT
jgi:hypothetical protein